MLKWQTMYLKFSFCFPNSYLFSLFEYAKYSAKFILFKTCRTKPKPVRVGELLSRWDRQEEAVAFHVPGSALYNPSEKILPENEMKCTALLSIRATGCVRSEVRKWRKTNRGMEPSHGCAPELPACYGSEGLTCCTVFCYGSWYPRDLAQKYAISEKQALC
ncbi:hypothetical protein CEXT_281241 [Caerostris extrusa]|uniref:Uncharacterized protein n=1 Tax=Caerostris extrusa TaxID=172846 RepID=A0AAV4Y212_CAEEX|nr:hypothetical protein CEXT_281241 [Caerostris extrusa]